MRPHNFTYKTALIVIVGLSAAIGLIAWQGFTAVGQAVWQVGWGLLAIVLWRFLMIFGDALAWRHLLKPAAVLPVTVLFAFRSIRDSANILLPVAQVGGDVLGARLLVLRGVATDPAGASVLVGKTLETAAQFLFTVAGLLLLVAIQPSDAIISNVALGLLIMVPALAGLVAVQWFGPFALVGRLLERRFAGAKARLIGLQADALALYRDWRRTGSAFLLHAATALAGAGEVWLVLWFMGTPVTVAEAIVIESIGQAVRSAAFAVPGSLGVQEAGYMIVGALFGLPPEKGLALSLIKRLRQLIIGVPALIGWQWIEGRHLVRMTAAVKAEP
jgi:putative membrane protein